MKSLCIVFLVLLAVPCFAADLGGNWVVRDPLPDGTFRTTYLDLHQEGSRITGTIRVTQFYFKIVESTGGPDGFTLTGSMMDGTNERRVKYEGKLVGDELRVTTRRRPDSELIQMVAHRAPPGEGAYSARLPLPAIHKVADNGLARTPPMGWNSWNKFAGRVDDAAVRAMADAMASNGMKEAGYQYINIDDTWEAGRDAQGNITTNTKFPDMKALADYVHAKGLKIGIYSSPGPNTCAGYEGSYGHEDQDARTYAAWGIDYLKYDWCGAGRIYRDEEMQAVYQKMGDALRAAPLLAGNDLRSMSPDTLAILANRGVIAIDQDPLGRQGHRVRADESTEVWERPLASGAHAVGLFNRGTSPAHVEVRWSELGLMGT